MGPVVGGAVGPCNGAPLALPHCTPTTGPHAHSLRVTLSSPLGAVWAAGTAGAEPFPTRHPRGGEVRNVQWWGV